MRRATVILWLMLALLPLRGWAVASMGMDMPAAAAAASAETATPASPMPGCHEAADDDGRTSASCQACDWCHAALGLAAQPAVAESPAPSVQPAPAIARDTGRPAVGGLDRPPRSLLA